MACKSWPVELRESDIRWMLAIMNPKENGANDYLQAQLEGALEKIRARNQRIQAVADSTRSATSVGGKSEKAD